MSIRWVRSSYLLRLLFRKTFSHSIAVLQTYKIVMCFIISWVVLLFGEEFAFTPWGFVSALFMIPGGTAGYFAVRNAGLAVSQGIWSSLKVLVAFCWGILIFQEPVRSKVGTATAILFLMFGLAGMSYFAAPPSPLFSGYESISQPLIDEESGSESIEDAKNKCGCFRNRRLGLLGAVIDGAYGGSILVPMHFAGREKTKGLAYVLSFAIGCAVLVTIVWILRYLYYCARAGSFVGGAERMPSFHLMVIGPYASLAGLIWSVGNISSILSVSLLGEGVGYSIVQSQLLIAGLWGVCWYREIQGVRIVTSWFLFAIITVVGIILLSQEHVAVPMSQKQT